MGSGQPQAHEWVHQLSQVLKQALGEEKQLPEREPHRLAVVLNACPSLELIMDGTERCLNRPQDKAELTLLQWQKAGVYGEEQGA